MKQNLACYFTLFFTTFLFAQNDRAYVDSLTTDYALKVKEAGANNVFSMQRFCEGNVQFFKLSDGTTCTSRGTYIESYVVYNHNNKTKIVKIDNCGTYQETSPQDEGLMDYYVGNMQAIQNSNIKPFKTANPNTNPRARTTVYNCHRGFVFYSGTAKKQKEYSLYALANEGDQPNLNYEHNNEQAIVSLEAKLSEQIELLDNARGFIRN